MKKRIRKKTEIILTIFNAMMKHLTRTHLYFLSITIIFLLASISIFKEVIIQGENHKYYFQITILTFSVWLALILLLGLISGKNPPKNNKRNVSGDKIKFITPKIAFVKQLVSESQILNETTYQTGNKFILICYETEVSLALRLGKIGIPIFILTGEKMKTSLKKKLKRTKINPGSVYSLEDFQENFNPQIIWVNRPTVEISTNFMETGC